jgi:DNA repair photolyase
MRIKEITSKTALSPSKLPGLDYALNPYFGCSHQCSYCYVPTVLRIPRHTWGETIFIKRNLPLVLTKELPMKKPGIIGISTVTDPYQPIENKYNVTRYCLHQLLKYDFPIQIQTKSDLVLKDITLLNKFSNVEIMISIGTSNDIHRSILEPNASPINKRIYVLEELRNYQHIKTSVFLGPLYPNLEWEQLKSLLDILIEKNVSKIMIDNIHLKPGLKAYLLPIIKQHPSLYTGFSEHVFTSSNWYQNMEQQIKEYIDKKSSPIRTIKAF